MRSSFYQLPRFDRYGLPIPVISKEQAGDKDLTCSQSDYSEIEYSGKQDRDRYR